MRTVAEAVGAHLDWRTKVAARPPHRRRKPWSLKPKAGLAAGGALASGGRQYSDTISQLPAGPFSTS